MAFDIASDGGTQKVWGRGGGAIRGSLGFGLVSVFRLGLSEMTSEVLLVLLTSTKCNTHTQIERERESESERERR